MVQHSGSLTDLCSEDGVHYNKADTVLWLKRKEKKKYSAEQKSHLSILIIFLPNLYFLVIF